MGEEIINRYIYEHVENNTTMKSRQSRFYTSKLDQTNLFVSLS